MITIKDQAGITGEQGAVQAERLRLNPLRQVRLVSSLFEAMDAEQRQSARQAAVDFLKDRLEENVFVAVFIVDQFSLPLAKLAPGGYDLRIVAVQAGAAAEARASFVVEQ